MNKASNHCLLNPELPKYVMQKPNPSDLASRDIAKFDTQNPIVGNLLKQIQSSKFTYQSCLEVLGDKK